MLRRRTLSIALLVVACLCGLGTTSGLRAAPYSDPNGHFTFTVPDGYLPFSAAPTAANIATIGYRSPNVAGASVIVSVTQDAPDDISAPRLAALFPALPGFESTTATPQATTLGDLPAMQWERLGPPLGGRIHILYLVVSTHDALYSMVFTAPDSDFARFFQESAPLRMSFRAGETAKGDGTTRDAFADPEGRFRISLPVGFTTLPAPEAPIVAQFKTGDPSGDVTISADGQPDDVTLEAFGESTIAAAMEQDPGMRLTDRTAATLGGKPALRVTYALGQRSVVQIISVFDATGYVITGSTAAEARVPFERLIDQLVASWIYL